MIREINEKDYKQIEILLKQLSPQPIEINSIDLISDIKRINSLDHMKIIGFELDDKIAGMCTIGRIEGISKNSRPFSVIENLIVKESLRSKGIGKKLLKHAIEIAKKWNCYKLILETGSKQGWKLSFYKKCGLTCGDKTAFIKRFK